MNVNFFRMRRVAADSACTVGLSSIRHRVPLGIAAFLNALPKNACHCEPVWCSAQRIKILMTASGNCAIMYRWHGAAVTDEGLASPSGRGAGGGKGDFCPLSRLRRQLPQSGSQGGTRRTDCDRRESPEGATPVCALVRNDMRFSTLHTLLSIVPKGHRTYSLFTLHFSLFIKNWARGKCPAPVFSYQSRSSPSSPSSPVVRISP